MRKWWKQAHFAQAHSKSSVRGHSGRRRWLKWTGLLVLLGVAVAGGINAAVYYGGADFTSPEAAEPAQAILVLGAYVYPSGRPSDMVVDRLEMAYTLYQAGKAPKILISGDHGQVEYDEVNAMRRYLEAKGVPPEDIFMDHAGFDTYNSMYRARNIFHVKSAIVVTQAFHLPRAVWLARRMGLEAEGVVADRWQYAGAEYYALREAAARVKAFGEVAVHARPVFLGPAIPITGDGRATHDQPR
ncbi:MAG TPA: ElyC/SanA/YdcF family protein [Symbiobacteriaceae bacterium]|jgi:SanA protein|nr:ElyC/SanA/YdcF family protein [Symbiobacteriaceae bacterium]